MTSPSKPKVKRAKPLKRRPRKARHLPRWGDSPDDYYKERYQSNDKRFAIKKTRKDKMNLNHIIVSGRLIDSPKLIETANGYHIAEFPLSFVQGYGENKDYGVVQVRAFGKRADQAKQELQKGFMIGVDGNLFQDKYISKLDGKKKSRMCIIAQGWQIFSKKYYYNEELPTELSEPKPEPKEPTYGNGAKDLVPEDLPF